ncbi:hypothetical protein OJAV_G00136600 [Oryzias javanicus]|uniref:Integrase zinc-binding domain-containing protein n=1 Tax=Oryzias javanicus TaxID=123683 RepID=A0A437CL11_ORYJA|nr:hypothetical protein OJAV_G00136600 [Oryzias javanicus]
MQSMRLVVLSEEEKRSVLMECHQNSGTGNHSGMRGTRNKVIPGYLWKTLKQDVDEWVHQGPYTVTNITPKGLATIKKGETHQKVNVSRLRNYRRYKNPSNESNIPFDHSYVTTGWQTDHQYGSPGPKWQKDINTLQSSLLDYVLDQNRPAQELLVKEGNICLTREDFWSLGLEKYMESTIGNACLKIVEEAAKRHGKNVHISDLYVVPTWKDPDVNLLSSFPDDYRSKDVLLFPAWSRQPGEPDHYLLCAIMQFSGNDCGIFMLMYALCICTSSPLSFSQEEMPAIRRWWCIQLMERFSIDGYGIHQGRPANKKQ